jgi:hypothetical protein
VHGAWGNKDVGGEAVGHRWIVAALGALCCMLFAPAVANAGFLTEFDAKPIAASAACNQAAAIDAPAGGHRDFCVSLVFGANDDAKQMDLDLPPGVVGDPTAAPTCPQATFETGTCPSNTQVGDVAANATLVLINANLTGQVYNLQPSATEPARLGIYIDPSPLGGGLAAVRLQSSVRVRITDYGLRSSVPSPGTPDISNQFHVNSMALTLWGTKVDHPSLAAPFISLPTRCDVPATASVTVRTYGGQTDTKTSSFPVADCAHVPFTPGLEVGPKQVHADTPGQAFAILKIPNTDTGTGNAARRQSYVRQVNLQLPPGLMLNPPIGDGLQPCTEAEFGQYEDRAPSCSPSSEIGTVAFKTPIFAQPLTGKVYFGEGTPGHLLRNFVSVEDPRLRVKLIGDVTIDPNTGAVLNTFNDSPQVPFETFTFTYQDEANGRHAVLTSPTACGPRTVVSPMVPWTGAAAAQSPTDTFDTIGCLPPVFAPKLVTTPTSTQAGGDTGLKVHIERADKQERLKQLTVSLPPGLTGRLTAVPPCKVADARAGRCPASSQVGTAAVAVGTGPSPLSLPGKVFLTEGYDGALAGLAVIVNTKIPALDLGIVTVMNKIMLRADTGLDVVTEDLPQMLQGIPTVYRSIDMTIDKPGFMRNATNCAQQQAHATFNAVGGASATSDSPYQATGCDKLPFNPKMTTRVGAPKETGKNSHPPLNVVIEQADGESAMAKTVVTLPVGVGVDIKNLSSVCTDAQLQSQTCPPGSRIGDVSAVTPLLPQTLSGGAYLTQGAKPGALPGIALDLGLVRLKGSVNLAGRVTTTFDSVPDVPLRKLTLSLTGGPKAVLTTTVDLCDKPPSFDAQYVSQSGVSRSATVPAEVIGCGPLSGTGELTGVAKRRPVLRMKLTSLTPLKELRLKLPSSLKPASARTVRRARLLLGGKWARDTKVRLSKGSLVFRASPGTTTKAPQITIPRGVLKQRKRIRVGTILTVTVTGITSGGKAVSAKIPVIAK